MTILDGFLLSACRVRAVVWLRRGPISIQSFLTERRTMECAGNVAGSFNPRASSVRDPLHPAFTWLATFPFRDHDAEGPSGRRASTRWPGTSGAVSSLQTTPTACGGFLPRGTHRSRFPSDVIERPRRRFGVLSTFLGDAGVSVLVIVLCLLRWRGDILYRTIVFNTASGRSDPDSP